MPTRLNPYIAFRGTAREAMEFYRSVFGGELTVTTFGEAGMDQHEGAQDQVMHAMLTTDSGLTLMASDAPLSMEMSEGSSISMSLSGEDDAELRGYWERLSESGTVLEPLVQAPWGDTFGMCIDRYGTSWMVNIAGQSS